jgi:hypothetical protein
MFNHSFKTASILGFLIIFNCPKSISQTADEYYSKLKKGVYEVGFKSVCVFDTTRNYDLNCGEQGQPTTNKELGRPILLNIWYPAEKTAGSAPMLLKDFFDFPVIDGTTIFFKKLKEYQFQNSKVYAVNQNLSKYDIIKEGDTSLAGRDLKRAKIFENYINSGTMSFKNAQEIGGNFPLIIYHQGLGGTVDENYVLLEYLASNGFIVINSAFQVGDGSGYNDGWFVGVGDYEQTFADYNFIINYCQNNKISKNKEVFLSGHSFGANCAITFIGQGNKNVTGLIPLDSDYGYVLNNFFPKKYNPFTADKLKHYKNLPIFCANRSEAHFKMVDSLTQSQRYYLTIADMKHNDFTSQGGIGRSYCLPYAIEKEKYKTITQNYLHLCEAILKFADANTKANKLLDKSEITNYPGWKFEVCKQGQKLKSNAPFNPNESKCPTLPQFIDIVNFKGIKDFEKVYEACNDSTLKKQVVTDAFDFIFEGNDSILLRQYLNWMYSSNLAESNLGNIYASVFYLCMFDRGDGYEYAKALPTYRWIIEKYPKNKIGYIGMAAFLISLNAPEAMYYCKKVVEINPNYINTISTNNWDEQTRARIQIYMENKK